MWMSERWREAGSWREWRSRWEVGASRVGLQVRKSRLWTSTINWKLFLVSLQKARTSGK